MSTEIAEILVSGEEGGVSRLSGRVKEGRGASTHEHGLQKTGNQADCGSGVNWLSGFSESAATGNFSRESIDPGSVRA